MLDTRENVIQTAAVVIHFLRVRRTDDTEIAAYTSTTIHLITVVITTIWTFKYILEISVNHLLLENHLTLVTALVADTDDTIQFIIEDVFITELDDVENCFEVL
jgi:hypothetical protein